MVDLAQHVPSDWVLFGFDLSAAQFPAWEFLPPNISLKTMDAFGDIPRKFVGKFDVVHLRALPLVVEDGDPDPLIRNVMAMLSMSFFASNTRIAYKV